MNASEEHFIIQREQKGRVEFYRLDPGIGLSFNRIYSDSWEKGDDSVFGKTMLILNFCLSGRCDASLSQNHFAIVKERQVCISTILPSRDFYYPGRRYEGIQLYLDLDILRQAEETDFLTKMGVPAQQICGEFCQKSEGVYLHRMNDALFLLVQHAWEAQKRVTVGDLRYLAVRLLHELKSMPPESEQNICFTHAQIAMVKEAERIIMSDLSRRIPAKELAGRFGISESSFKFCVRGILGDSYLTYFRRKRMEKAAELLKTTPMKVMEIAEAVGYENQGKFAKAFATVYGVSPLAFRKSAV